VRPLSIELFAGLHGWGAGLSAAGFRVVGFDITDMPRLLGHPVPEHCSLVLQDVRTLHGSQFRNAHLIVASPPCQEFSYMAMPFSRGKRIAAALRGQGEFPEGYRGSRTIPELTALFDACFRIQREASEAAGRYIPLVIENVRGAQPWVGRAKWSYGSYYLWGDVPALMPSTLDGRKVANKYSGNGSWKSCDGLDWRDPANVGLQSAVVAEHIKQGGSGAAWFDKAVDERRKAATAATGRKANGSWFGNYAEAKEKAHLKGGGDWFSSGTGMSVQRFTSSNSPARRAASALIAKIPFALAEHIGRVYYPHEDSCAQRDQRAKKTIEKIGELV